MVPKYWYRSAFLKEYLAFLVSCYHLSIKSKLFFLFWSVANKFLLLNIPLQFATLFVHGVKVASLGPQLRLSTMTIKNKNDKDSFV